MLESIRMDAFGCSRVGSELAFAFGKPSLRSSQASEKGHGEYIPVAPCHNRHPGVTIPFDTGCVYARPPQDRSGRAFSPRNFEYALM